MTEFHLQSSNIDIVCAVAYIFVWVCVCVRGCERACEQLCLKCFKFVQACVYLSQDLVFGITILCFISLTRYNFSKIFTNCKILIIWPAHSVQLYTG